MDWMFGCTHIGRLCSNEMPGILRRLRHLTKYDCLCRLASPAKANRMQNPNSVRWRIHSNQMWFARWVRSVPNVNVLMIKNARMAWIPTSSFMRMSNRLYRHTVCMMYLSCLLCAFRFGLRRKFIYTKDTACRFQTTFCDREFKWNETKRK